MSRPDTLAFLAPHSRARTLRAIASASGLVAALAFAAACSSGSGPQRAESPTGSPVVAEVNGREITLAELDEHIAVQLYEARAEALDELVQELVLETEAAERGLEAGELVELEAQQLGAVTDEEVAAFFEENRERMRPDETLDNVAPRIRSYLEQQRRMQAFERIRESASVTVRLEPPRIAVEATGPSRGAADAAVTIVEFSDYQCPFCRRAEPVVDQVLERYPEDVRLVFRHMPLDSIHPQARDAAVAAVCAHEQDRFWAYHDELFENQQSLGSEDLTRMADELGLDVEAFETCREGPEAAQVVVADLAAAQAAGATGTPAFYVNGVKLSGARPLEDFVEVIEKELSRDQR